MESLRPLGAFPILLIAVTIPLQSFGNVCVYKPPTVSHIRGAIVDRTNYPIPQAQIAVMREDETLQTIITDDKGEFSFNSLPVGKYEIDVGARGFQHTRYMLRLSSRKNPKQVLRITLGVGSIQCNGSIEGAEETPKQQ